MAEQAVEPLVQAVQFDREQRPDAVAQLLQAGVIVIDGEPRVVIDLPTGRIAFPAPTVPGPVELPDASAQRATLDAFNGRDARL